MCNYDRTNPHIFEVFVMQLDALVKSIIIHTGLNCDNRASRHGTCDII